MKTIALVSMLHEAADCNSATRRFRDRSVLDWTLKRLGACPRLADTVVIAWDDQQVERAQSIGARCPLPNLDAVTAAQRWSDGWRGGLLSSCAFDRGFVAPVARRFADELSADAIVLVDPAAALVDPEIIDRLIAAAEASARDFFFTQAPPGLAGALLKRPLIDRLASGNTHPGRIVHYLPDAPMIDPITSESCVPLPLPLTRSLDRFLLDSTSQIERITRAVAPLNGELISSSAEQVARCVAQVQALGTFPRELTIELTTRRACEPVFLPRAARSDLPVEAFERIVEQARRHDDVRLCLAGVGDPVLHPCFPEVIERCRGLSVSVETDLIDVDDAALAALLGVDIVAVHLPAMTPATYQKLMGRDVLQQAIENIKRLLTLRQGRGTPIVAPLFTKTAHNLDEMEQWHDTWLRAVGSAVIVGLSTYAGLVPFCGAVDMTPPVRRACARIQQRLHVLSDGHITACDQDVGGRLAMGDVMADPIDTIWHRTMRPLRDAHRTLSSLPVLCGNCSEWHRP